MEPPAYILASERAATITIYELILSADPIVKGMMALLVLASIICWAGILEKIIRLSAFGRQISGELRSNLTAFRAEDRCRTKLTR